MERLKLVCKEWRRRAHLGRRRLVFIEQVRLMLMVRRGSDLSVRIDRPCPLQWADFLVGDSLGPSWMTRSCWHVRASLCGGLRVYRELWDKVVYGLRLP